MKFVLYIPVGIKKSLKHKCISKKQTKNTYELAHALFDTQEGIMVTVLVFWAEI